MQVDRDRILELSQDLISIAGLDGFFKYLNPAWEKVLGYANEEILSKPFLDFVHPDDRPSTLRELKSLTAGSQAVNFENRYFHKDGSIRYLSWMATPLPDEGVIYASARDITEQKHAEQELRRSEQRFRSLMEQSPLAIEILAPNGQISQVNAAWRRLWGLSEEEAAQTLAKYNMLTDKQTADLGVAPLIRKAFEGEAVVLPPIEYVGSRTLDDLGLKHLRARSPWIQCHLYPVKNENDEVLYVVNTYMEITDLKQAEEQLKAYQGRLRALALELTLSEERERRRIATELHDGPAQSLSYARMQVAAARKAPSESQTAESLETVSRILRESLQQIRDVLLDLSSPSMNEIGLAAAISEWLDQQVARRHGLRTSFVDKCGKVPLAEDARTVLFRNTRELLTNVVKHAGAGAVSVCVESTGQELKIRIEDDGAGFDPDAVGRTSEGEGFGLFSIRERMLDLGGTLEIVSAPGEGCKATLVMPLDAGEDDG